jgi:2-dehydropantoate 2-reductase
MVKIAIHGAGSIGCFIGGAWAHAGLDITLIGREYTGKSIADNGLHITDYEGFDVHIAAEKIAFATTPNCLANADIIALTVKSTATSNAATEIKAHARKGATVISFQNGISNTATLRDLLPDQKVIAGMVPFNVANMGNGLWHKGTNGALMAEKCDALHEIAAKTMGSPAALELKSDMTAIAWGKLLLNLNNALNALSGETLLAQLSQRDSRIILAATIRESLKVLKAAHIKPAKVGAMAPSLLPAFVSAPDFLFNTIGLKLQKIDAKARSSMAEDFHAGRKTEIDFLNGEVVALGAKHGVATPFNNTIVQLIKDAENGGQKIWHSAMLKRKVFAD